MIGHNIDSLECGGKLPLGVNVLQYLKYCQSLPDMQKASLKSIICCPLRTGTKSASCKFEGCMKEGSPSKKRCVVAAVSESWDKAGIPMISDQSKSDKIRNLLNKWKDCQKHKDRKSLLNVNKREKLQSKLDGLFDIGSKDAVKIIKEDRLRTEKTREEDILFYEDQKGKHHVIQIFQLLIYLFKVPGR